jgi:hypothetical protein
VSAIPGFSYEVRNAGGSRIQPGKGVQDALVQTALVAFDCQDVVSAVAPAGNGLGDFLLAAHGIDGHDAALEMEHPDQFWQGGNLVALLLNSQLAQDQAIGAGPGADHVHWAVAPVAGSPEGLAVQRHHVPGDLLPHPVGPAQEGFLECLRVEHLENPVEGVVGRDADR